MALSNLTSLTQAQYEGLTITPFPTPPGRTSTGNPDNRIWIDLGGWVGTDVLAFIVTDQATADSSLSIDTKSTNTLDANVVTAINPGAELSYWTVNMGPGASGSNWEITFNVTNGSTPTGTWVFVKGKSIDVDYAK